jgi:hypothetical protein
MLGQKGTRSYQDYIRQSELAWRFEVFQLREDPCKLDFSLLYNVS